tara:strand:+ start:291998 stop:293437 length:1440 start_codon:yes stop_codon:yes gene_type:complete
MALAVLRVLIGCLFVICVCSASRVAAATPNIVLILADDLGYGDVGAFNADSKIPTPNLDRLAAEGMRFTDAHAGGSVCVPSRYSLLTGRFSVRDKLQWRDGPVIKNDQMTIASLLKQHGYRTSMVGKWHQGFDTPGPDSDAQFDYDQPLRGGPVDRGFQTFFGMHASLDIPPYFYIRDRTPVVPPTDSIDASTSVGGKEDWNKIQGAFWREGPVAPGFVHTEVTPRFAREAVEVLQAYAATDNEAPLFLYLALPSPHTPWLPTEAFRGKSGAGMYGDFVMQVDAVVGQVVSALNSTAMSNDTLVLFSSDNGPVWYDTDTDRFGHDAVGGLRGMKGSSWEGGHRMPFIARWPGHVTPGTASDQTIAFSDVFATFADLVGSADIPAGQAEDSVSFLPFLLDAEMPRQSRAPIVHNSSTLRDGDWKLILPRRKRELGKTGSQKLGGELYNLRDDPNEEKNLFESESERVERMQKKLASILAS